MNTPHRNHNDPNDKNGCLAPVLALGSLCAVWGIANLVGGDDKALSNNIIMWGFFAWLTGLFLVFIAGKNLKETRNNFVGLMYLIGLIIAVSLVLGVLSLLIPSSCTQSGSPSPTELYYRW